MLRIIAISGDRIFYRIGEDLKNSHWFKSTNVSSISVAKGDNVEIKFDKDDHGVNILSEIKVLVPTPQTTTGSASTATTTTFEKKEWRSKSPAEGEEIRRQAVGKMVAETVKVFKDVSDVDWLCAAIEKLYNAYDKVTKG